MATNSPATTDSEIVSEKSDLEQKVFSDKESFESIPQSEESANTEPHDDIKHADSKEPIAISINCEKEMNSEKSFKDNNNLKISPVATKDSSIHIDNDKVKLTETVVPCEESENDNGSIREQENYESEDSIYEDMDLPYLLIDIDDENTCDTKLNEQPPEDNIPNDTASLNNKSTANVITPLGVGDINIEKKNMTILQLVENNIRNSEAVKKRLNLSNTTVDEHVKQVHCIIMKFHQIRKKNKDLKITSISSGFSSAEHKKISTEPIGKWSLSTDKLFKNKLKLESKKSSPTNSINKSKSAILSARNTNKNCNNYKSNIDLGKSALSNDSIGSINKANSSKLPNNSMKKNDFLKDTKSDNFNLVNGEKSLDSQKKMVSPEDSKLTSGIVNNEHSVTSSENESQLNEPIKAKSEISIGNVLTTNKCDQFAIDLHVDESADLDEDVIDELVLVIFVLVQICILLLDIFEFMLTKFVFLRNVINLILSQLSGRYRI